jgi:pimeloyl-ACP methyl ester carboxylesterase
MHRAADHKSYACQCSLSLALKVAGDIDSLISVQPSTEAKEAIAGLDLVILPSGHAAPIEAADQLNTAVLDFLGKPCAPG